MPHAHLYRPPPPFSNFWFHILLQQRFTIFCFSDFESHFQNFQNLTFFRNHIFGGIFLIFPPS